MFPRRPINTDKSSSSNATGSADPPLSTFKLRPFLLPRPDIDSIAPHDRLGGGMTGESNKPRQFLPFAPRPGDLRSYSAPRKEGERCAACGSNIVLNPLYKKDGTLNVVDAQPVQTETRLRGIDAQGNPRMQEMVWSCRINRHPYPYPHEVNRPNSRDGEHSTSTSASASAGAEKPPTRMSVAGVERYVNAIQGFYASGNAQKAKEAMREMVLMNEGKKPESFEWLEKNCGGGLQDSG
ncbi:hypothetical protein DRE_07276 [Drechslerella stenobrocha 248]|uniref:Uncharacterized protein n=1 Tax=Drechslerella stenobrocha 248 TaxID=1043628 RepID=W7HUV4_9PEZI|nr:hypothetical protein DRE_07276 [Drechslerella stenobrocha 248]